MKLIINRSKWLRGDSNSYLLRAIDSKMCCLGFLACSLGATEDNIKNVVSPSAIPSVKWIDGMLHDCAVCTKAGHVHRTDTDITNKLMLINDRSDISDLERETQLKELFAQIDIEVEFID